MEKGKERRKGGGRKVGEEGGKRFREEKERGWRGIDGKEGREKERGERLNKKGWRRTEDTRN